MGAYRGRVPQNLEWGTSIQIVPRFSEKNPISSEKLIFSGRRPSVGGSRKQPQPSLLDTLCVPQNSSRIYACVWAAHRIPTTQSYRLLDVTKIFLITVNRRSPTDIVKGLRARDGTVSGFLTRDPTRPGRWALWNKSSTTAWLQCQFVTQETQTV